MTVSLYPDIVKQKNLAPDHFGSEIDELCEEVCKISRRVPFVRLSDSYMFDRLGLSLRSELFVILMLPVVQST